MINETYKSMLSGKSVIRELNEYANDSTRHPHLKPEDIFDYSLGNPSVPVPEAFNARVKALLDSGDPIDFTDVTGTVYHYQVIQTEILPDTAVEEMEQGNWDLTLFTCTLSGTQRVTVRCERIS